MIIIIVLEKAYGNSKKIQPEARSDPDLSARHDLPSHSRVVYQQLKPQFPDLSLGTVYRNLAAFKAEGVIDSVGVVNGLERYDGNTIPHAHIVCESCSAVLDAETIELPDELLAHVQQDTGCEIRRYQISFTGVCPNCLQKH